MLFRTSLVAQTIKNLPSMRGPQFDAWVGKTPGEGIGCSLQYPWDSLVAQRVKNLPAMQETWVQPLGWKEPLKKGMRTHSSIVAW